MVLLLLLALFAERNPLWKTLLFEMFNAYVIVWKLAVKVIYRVPKMLWDCLSAVHFVALADLN